VSSEDKRLRFIVDANVARIGRWLRMMGFDTLVFNQPDDWEMVRIALEEGRIIITRDTQVVKRRVISTGQVRALLVSDDNPGVQIQDVIRKYNLRDYPLHPFFICLEDNTPLVPRLPGDVKDRVPPYVFKTQHEFVECPACHRIYWKGTHWQAMNRQLGKLLAD